MSFIGRTDKLNRIKKIVPELSKLFFLLLRLPTLSRIKSGDKVQKTITLSMRLDSKQFVPFVLVIAFIGLVAIVFSSFNFNSKQLETFNSGLQEGTDQFLEAHVPVLQTGFLEQEMDSVQMATFADEPIIMLFAARWSDKSAQVVDQLEQIIARFDSVSSVYNPMTPKLVIALVLDTREGYVQQVEGEKLERSNGVSYESDEVFSERHLVVDGSTLFNEFQIPGIPTLIYLADGHILWTQVGYRNSSQLEPLISLLEGEIGNK